MTKKMIALASVATFVLVLALAAGAQDKAASVAGAWSLTQPGRNGTNTQTMTLEQNGAAITGTIKGGRGDAPLTGSVSGKGIMFSVKRTTPNGEITQDYKGTVDGDAMKGTVAMGQNNVEWSATRSK